MKRRQSFWVAPAVFFAGLLALFVTWLVMEPAALHQAFDQKGHSFFELATLPFYAAIIPFVWWKCPYEGSRARRILLCTAVSCVAFMAVCKELDLHLAAMQTLYPDFVGADGSVHGLVKPNGEPLAGTPFKMRVLTNAAVPLSAKIIIVFYFMSFFGVFAALLVYFSKDLVRGFLTLNPAAWSVCFLGGSGVMVQLCDRMPAWIRHLKGLPKGETIDSISSFFTAFEEGGEMLIAIFAIMAICQAHAAITAEQKAVCPAGE